MEIDQVRVGCIELPMPVAMTSAVGNYSSTHNVIVEVKAGDVTGEGVSLTFTQNQAAAVASIVRDLIPVLVGADGRMVRRLWHQMMGTISLPGQSGLAMFAVAALDAALWDLSARSVGQPLFRLLGGSADSLATYAQPGWLSMSVEEVIEEAMRFHDMGFRYYKMRVGTSDWRRDVQRVRSVSEAIPEAMGLLVDVNQGWSRMDALAACRALDELDLVWIEEPVSAQDLEGAALLSARVRTPVALGENAFGFQDIRTIVQCRSAAIVMLDLQHCGGPTGWLDSATAVEQSGLAVSNHLFTEVSIHLLASLHRPSLVEHMPGWWDDLYDSPLLATEGRIAPPTEPGIGRRFSERTRNALEVS
jgi:L-alanine-DL-glutamate epimerase-like enolase superfamily enzyme